MNNNSFWGKVTIAFNMIGISINFKKITRFIVHLPIVLREYKLFEKQFREYRKDTPLIFKFPFIDDIYSFSGNIISQYFIQDLFVANRIFQRKPARHIDVGSRVDGFVAHVATFREIEVLDIRPLDIKAFPQIKFRQYNILDDLPLELKCSCDSVSCLHALEHFGLGRYGDPICGNGEQIGLKNLAAILKPNGILYLSVPVGAERVEFNEKRVFSIEWLLSLASENNLSLINFSLVDESFVFHQVLEMTSDPVKKISSSKAGCGIFEFVKN